MVPIMKVFRVIDFETTGFPPKSGIVEIAWTDLQWQGSVMKVGETTSFLVNPGIPSEPGALAVHRIKDSELIGKPRPETVLRSIEDGADYIVAHNLKFEEAFASFELPTICTLKCARQMIDAPTYKNAALMYHLNLELDEARTYPAHRAGPDTYITAHILLHLLKLSAQMGGDFVGRLVDITNKLQLLKTVSFGKHKGLLWCNVPHDYLRWVLSNDKAEPDVKHTAEYYLNGGK
jgi:exodeoxyribonuclease X